MTFWDQFWSTMWGALAGALVAGALSGLIAWRVFASEQKGKAEDQRRESFERVLTYLSRMVEMVSTSSDVDRARALNHEFYLAVNRMTLGLPELDRDRFRYWHMDLGESFIAMVGWVDAPEWRQRGDQFGQLVTIASAQLEAWYTGEESTACLILERDDARERFMPTWTDWSIGRT